MPMRYSHGERRAPLFVGSWLQRESLRKKMQMGTLLWLPYIQGAISEGGTTGLGNWGIAYHVKSGS